MALFDYFEVDLPLYGIYPILIKKGGARARKLRPAEAGADHLASRIIIVVDTYMTV
jgi:hypothetical protein